jgi:MinD-like ATPase involved in chromosome partitioning or flagellar assembly
MQWSREGRARTRQLAEIASLQPALQTPMTGIGDRRIVVFSPQATKTSTLAMCLWVLAEARGDQVLGVDANPDKGKLRMRLCPAEAARPARGLTDLIQQVRKDLAVEPGERLLRTARDVQPALEQTPARLLRLICDAGTPPEAIAEHTAEDYLAVFDLLSEWFPILGIDIGRSQTTAATRAALAAADHLLVPWEADGTAMNLVLEALEDLVRFGHEELVARCTMVVTAQDPAAIPQTAIGYLQQLADRRHRDGRCPLWRSVVTVPYDEAAGPIGQIVFADLAPATQLAYTRVAARVAETFADTPSHHRFAAGGDPDGWFSAAPRPAAAAVRQLRPAERAAGPADHAAERSGS